MHDFICADPDDIELKFIAGRTRYLKKTEEGVIHMCPIIEDYAKECINEIKIEIAVNLLEMGSLTCTLISKCTKIPIEEIVNLAKTNGLAYNI